MSATASTTQDRVALLWERAEIERTILAFGRALDMGDWSLYRSTFEEIINVDFERLTGFPEVRIGADLWTRFAELALGPVRRHHQYSNMAIDVTGTYAEATVYMVARHWKSTDIGAAENTQYGWYEFTLTKRDECWRIGRLKHDFRWISGNGALLDFSHSDVQGVMERIFSPDNLVRRSGPTDAP